VQDWWDAWQRHWVVLPPGRCLPEIGRSVPIGGQQLPVRIDLAVLGQNGRALILDRKTEQPRPRHHGAQPIQTRLYPFVLVEGSDALNHGVPVRADAICLTYWPANEPRNPVVFRHSAGAHEATREQLLALARDYQRWIAR